MVILEGSAEKITDRVLLTRFANAYETKYQLRPGTGGGAAIYGLQPRVAHACRERDFPQSTTSWRFDRDG
jgi:hypothetical protein